MNCIYGYKKKSENKIVYIGKTNNIQNRRRQHEDIDPYCSSQREYNYPLSRGIRKYGKEEYECIILEDNISDDKIDERECYWIKYYNTYLDSTCYNQTDGGAGGHKYVDYSPNEIELAKSLIKQGIPFKDISNKLNMPIVTLSEINTGKRHYDSKEVYPLYKMTRGKKLSKARLTELYNDLQLGTPIAELAVKYNINKNYISAINTGRKYFNKDLSYPLYNYIAVRSCKLNHENILNIIDLLKNTTLSFKKIGQQYNVSDNTISRINSGKSYIQDNIIYPIRK